MLGPSRNDKIANLLRKAIAGVISNKLNDPRISNFVSISEVVLSADKSFAKVFVTNLGDVNDLNEVVSVLNKAKSHIRSHLSKVVQLRYLPNISFIADTALINAQRIADILEE